jgi:Fic family protein
MLNVETGMNPALFERSSAGRCALQRKEGYQAFIPNPLPPVLALDWELAALLAEANARVGELSGMGRQLPNPHLLISPYIRREATLSSRIENTQAGMDDLFYFEADTSEPPRVPDVKEVHNYVLALQYGIERVKTLPLSGRLVREIHKHLMEDIRGSYATPGEFRRTQNWIGFPGCTLMDATFVPPPVVEMMDAIANWEKYLNENSVEPVLVQCALMHYQFEAIHPFIDGNGRVGRLLITLMLCERGLLSFPLLYLSAYFEKHRDEYYRRLLAVSQEGDWRGWLEFFLRGVSIQAREACDNADAILGLYKKIQDQIRDSGKAPRHTLRIIEQLFINPVVTIPFLARELKLRNTSVQRCVDHLQKLGILEEVTGQRRNRHFVAFELLEILAGKQIEEKT